MGNSDESRSDSGDPLSAPEDRLAALSRRVQEADSDELERLVAEDSERLDEGAVKLMLKNPHVTREVLDMLARNRRLQSSYELRRLLVAHRLMPETHSLRLLSSLNWRDLVILGSDVKVRPAVRRAIDRKLASRLPGLSAGEKISAARRAGPGALALLLRDPSRMVVSAALDNPRLTEGGLLPALRHDQAAPVLLEATAAHRRWSCRYPVRQALCFNPATPPAVSLRLITFLNKADLRRLVLEPRVPQIVRRRAEMFLG